MNLHPVTSDSQIRSWRSDRRIAVVFSALLALVGSLGFVLVDGIGASADDPMSQFETNASGDTYGSALDARDPGLEPDLIAVLADNGNSGYAYKADLEPDHLQPSSPTEAVAMQGARDQKQIEAFVLSLSAALETPIKLDSAAEAALREVVSSPATTDGNPHAIADLVETLGVAANPVSSDDGGEETLGAVAAAVEAAREVLCREVPVYLSDGQTRVGVFTAGC